MNRMKQLRKYRQKNAQREVKAWMKEVYWRNILKQNKPMTLVQKARQRALMDERVYS